jgi:hypothetical protein
MKTVITALAVFAICLCGTICSAAQVVRTTPGIFAPAGDEVFCTVVNASGTQMTSVQADIIMLDGSSAKTGTFTVNPDGIGQISFLIAVASDFHCVFKWNGTANRGRAEMFVVNGTSQRVYITVPAN